MNILLRLLVVYICFRGWNPEEIMLLLLLLEVLVY